MRQNPLVTVITPLYNHAKYIATCLDSILAQTYQPLEIIVVDDGSTDEGPAIVETYADKGVKLIRNPRNGNGVARALNTAILNATGEYIAWVSSDDFYMPDKIEKSVVHFLEAQKTSPSIGALHTNSYMQIWDSTIKKYKAPPVEEIEAQIAENGYARWPMEMENHPKEKMIFQSLLWNQVNACTTLIPREVYLKVGLFKDTWSLSQDYDMWLRILFQGYEFAFVDEPLTVICFHDGNSDVYDAQVPAESFLLLRLYSHMMDKEMITQYLESIKYNQAYRAFYLELSQVFLDRCLYDHTLLYTEKFEKMGGSLSQDPEGVMAQMKPSFTPLSEIESNPYGFLLAIGEEQQATRLYAVLNHFLQAFSHQNKVSLTIWLYDDTPDIRGYIESLLEQAAKFWQLPRSVWPPIHYLESASIEEAIASARTFIPISGLRLLEQRLIYYYHRPGYLVQYLADAPYLKRSTAYFEMRPHLHTKDPPHLYTLLFLDRDSVPWVETLDEIQRFQTPSGWVEWHGRLPIQPLNSAFQHVYHLNDWRPLLKCTPEETINLHVCNHAAFKVLREQGWRAHFYLPSLDISSDAFKQIQPYDMFDSSIAFRILTVYSESNLTGWQETFQAYLQSYTLENSTELVIYVPTSESFEGIEEAVLAQLEIGGVSEAQAPHIMVLIEEDIGDLAEIIAIWAQVDMIVFPLKSPLAFQYIFNLVMALDGWLSVAIPDYFELDLNPQTHLLPTSDLEQPNQLTQSIAKIFKTQQEKNLIPAKLDTLVSFLVEHQRLKSTSDILADLHPSLASETQDV